MKYYVVVCLLGIGAFSMPVFSAQQATVAALQQESVEEALCKLKEILALNNKILSQEQCRRYLNLVEKRETLSYGDVVVLYKIKGELDNIPDCRWEQRDAITLQNFKQAIAQAGKMLEETFDKKVAEEKIRESAQSNPQATVVDGSPFSPHLLNLLPQIH